MQTTIWKDYWHVFEINKILWNYKILEKCLDFLVQFLIGVMQKFFFENHIELGYKVIEKFYNQLNFTNFL